MFAGRGGRDAKYFSSGPKFPPSLLGIATKLF